MEQGKPWCQFRIFKISVPAGNVCCFRSDVMHYDLLPLSLKCFLFNIKIANMIFLESPQCVGYSYANDSDCSSSDDQVGLTTIGPSVKVISEVFQ